MTPVPSRPGLAITLAWAALVLAGCGSDSPSGPEAGNWSLVWQDEFEGPAGQLPDAAKWQFDVGTDWGNAQLEYDTDRPENVSLDGAGHLAITVREEPYLGQDYTSGRIKTKDLFERNGGRFEARIRLPRGRGIWPAFWLLGADIDEVGWPTCGEIDVMEYKGQERSVVHGSLHGPGYSAGDAITRRFYLADSTFDADFHVFTVEWRGNSIDWYVDGELFQTVTPGGVSGEWVFDHPFFILLNVAVGGGFVGPPDATTTFPQTMLVDWVRVYEQTS
ncbi:MAG: glycoside hydrolase family 16 protein [marine benthic group bacterium]|jgi:beta-glucanase (GH16 family)|nr:glycoside hydrolase family 16 protein [Candidatus Benthicola marisminoris]